MKDTIEYWKNRVEQRKMDARRSLYVTLGGVGLAAADATPLVLSPNIATGIIMAVGASVATVGAISTAAFLIEGSFDRSVYESAVKAADRQTAEDELRHLKHLWAPTEDITAYTPEQNSPGTYVRFG